MRDIDVVKESDWKLFRKKLPDWQEAYMERLNKEYIELLNGEGDASHKFWALEKRLQEDKTHIGVISHMTRSAMEKNLIALLYEGAITLDDLNDFSDELRERITSFVRH